MNQIKEKLCDELSRIEEDTLYSMKGHYNASRSWSRWHIGLSLLGAILAVLAGINSFTGLDLIVKISAVGSAIVTSILGLLECSKKSESHKTSAGKFSEIKDEARQLREIYSDILSDKGLVEKVEILSKRKNSLNQSSLQIPRCSYKQAQKDIKAGHANYQVDQKGEK